MLDFSEVLEKPHSKTQDVLEYLIVGLLVCGIPVYALYLLLESS